MCLDKVTTSLRSGKERVLARPAPARATSFLQLNITSVQYLSFVVNPFPIASRGLFGLALLKAMAEAGVAECMMVSLASDIGWLEYCDCTALTTGLLLVLALSALVASGEGIMLLGYIFCMCNWANV